MKSSVFIGTSIFRSIGKEAIDLNSIFVNNVEYKIVKLLGKGKGGYSYLAERDGALYVVKQIHHEPCDYYTFGNKIEAEQNDYERLQNAGIRIPKMLDVDILHERIVKEYIDGDTIFEMIKKQRGAAPDTVFDHDDLLDNIHQRRGQNSGIRCKEKNGSSVEAYLPQVRAMAEQAKASGLNIDYFPTNFVVQDGLLYYIDYECNTYMEEWSFENWGVKYWSRTPEFENYLNESE